MYVRAVHVILLKISEILEFSHIFPQLAGHIVMANLDYSFKTRFSQKGYFHLKLESTLGRLERQITVYVWFRTEEGIAGF